MGKRIAALVLAVCMALPLFGCGGRIEAQCLTDGITVQTIDTRTDLTDDSSAVMDFAAALLRQTAGKEGVLLSPVSLLYALGMTANGASGETLAQLEQVTGMDRDTLNDYLYTYRMSLPENTKKCKLSLADSLWVRDGFRMEDGFLDACVNYYDAEVYRSAFDETMVSDLNHWVDSRTDGMIGKLLEEAPGSMTMLYLVNAVCFDARWQEPYEKSQIQEGAAFTAADGTHQTADLLWSEESIYLSDDDTTGFMKYYDGGRYAFVGLLPQEGVSLADYIAGLTGGKLHALLNGHQYGRVEAAIPRFTAASSLELSDALKAMGVTDAFDVAKADLRTMGGAPNDQLHIGSVLQKTYLELDENGTKAAAVTAIEAAAGAAEPPEVHRVVLDRPFVYMIVDTHANLPLFLGTVTTMD